MEGLPGQAKQEGNRLVAKMILGREIIARVLETKNIRPYLEAGLDLEFMSDQMHPAYAAVFTGQDIDAWTTILRHYEKYSKVMDVSLFRRSYPQESYRLVEPSFDDRELVDLAKQAISMFDTQVGTTEAQRYVEAGDPRGAAEIMMETARRVLHQQSESALVTPWDRKDYDLQERLDRRRRAAPGFGIDALDENFIGFQDGEIYMLLGRAKSGKTTFLIQSAYNAWLGAKSFSGKDIEPRRVLFVSFEVTEEGIRDRLTCYGAGVNPSNFLASTEDRHVTPEQSEKIWKWWETEMGDAAEAFTIVQPVSRFTITDLDYEVEKFQPDIIFIDGIYFMTDPATGSSPGSSPFAQDNIGRDLKNMAMRLRIPIVFTHQLREKQLGKAGGGVDDTAMMGGTGFRMASYGVWTFDKGEGGEVTCKNTASRGEYTPTICGVWDWDEFEFRAFTKEEDEDDY